MKIIKDLQILTITGNIKKPVHTEEIKAHLETLKAERHITVKIIDSISITSSVIGIFLKVIKKDGVALTVQVGNKHLYDLLNELNLLAVFNVRQI